MTRVAFLGLGAIGRPMARRVADAGFDLTVWNRTAARAGEFAAATGATAAATPADAVRSADVVLTCLPTSRDVAGLLDGPDGLLAALPRGALFVDCTSGDPATSKQIAARVAEREVAFVDAPVSGGTSGAEKGTLTLLGCTISDAPVGIVSEDGSVARVERTSLERIGGPDAGVPARPALPGNRVGRTARGHP